MGNDELVCNCFDVYKSEIVKAIKGRKLTNLRGVMDITGAGTACGFCQDNIQEILNDVNEK